MEAGLINIDPVRLETTKNLVTDASYLVERGGFDSAVILYVTAMEILGEALIRRLDIKANLLKKFSKRKHALRQFVAASLCLPKILKADPYLSNSVQFEVMRFERKLDKSEGKPRTLWKLEGGNAAAYYILHDCSNHKYALTGKVPLDLYQNINFWKNAALGFYDNQRMAIIHSDNDFDFTKMALDGKVIRNKRLDSQSSCGGYKQFFSNVMPIANDVVSLEILDRHINGVLIAFTAPLLQNSYDRS